MRASVEASSASVNAVSSSYRSRSTTDTLPLDRTRREATAAGCGADLVAVVCDLAAEEDSARPAGDVPPFVRVVVARRMHLGRADGPLLDRVEEHEVRVLAHGDLTLRAQAGEPRRRRREDIDESLDGEPLLAHSF